MLELRNIRKVYPVGDNKVEALRGLSVSFRKNEFVSILGPSGCGKTTLLNIIGGLDRYTEGDLQIQGVSTKEYKDRDWDSYRNHSVGFVFQSYNLIPHQSVLSNVELALTLSGVPRKERRERARKVLEKVGLGDQLSKRPNQLSGGQMQRVAIARALVNNPSILLADEPTGALDSETSVQIMELLKEVAKDRLVIMVTHNPELAEAYSTRIIRLLDGKVVDDSNPFEGEKEQVKEKKHKKPSMSFRTALSLSFNNLMTKKTRTALISFAGSIGIIGIALILSLSNGIQLLIDRVERETLSSYPIMLQETSMDFTAMMELTNAISPDEEREEGQIYSINVMSGMMDSMISGSRNNNLSAFKAHLESGESGITELTSDISYSYATPMQVYRITEDGRYMQTNPNQLFVELGMMADTELVGDMYSTMGMSFDVWTQLTSDQELLETQYELVAGSMPQSYDEVVLIVNENNEITDFSLYSLGLLDVNELKKTLMLAANGEAVEIDNSRRIYSFDDILSLEYKLLTNTDIYSKENGLWVDKSQDSTYLLSLLHRSESIRVVGIIRPAEGAATMTAYGMVGYRSDLMTHLIDRVNHSTIVEEQMANPTTDIFTGQPFATEESAKTYTMADLNAFAASLPAEQQAEIMGYAQQMLATGMDETTVATQLMNSMMGASSDATYEGNLEKMGVADLDHPTQINLYPKDFEAKNQISDLIAAYNAALPEEEQLAYTDQIALMISSITTIINAVSYVLIAFVSVSLIVSSIMIGIITYISVLERTREIGVLRSIGASKRDISRVFNAETLTIGLCAGLFGIGITFLLLIPINAVIEYLTSLSGVAVLPPAAAVILIGISMLLTFIAGLLPARIAAKKDPVIALRSE